MTPNNEEEAKPSSGWQTPHKPGSWREPEKRAGWNVPALPKNLEGQPAETGAWHLPDAKDTPFTEADEIEIESPEDQVSKVAQPSQPKAQQSTQTQPSQPSPSPEDALLKMATASSDEMEAQRTADAQKPKEPTAPEDFMAMLEKLEEEEPENDSFSMSELVALASLVDEEPKAAPGSTQGQPPVTAQTDAQAPTTDDPGEYARRALAALEGGTDSPATGQTQPTNPTGPQAAVTTGPDPGEYARQQLAALEGGSAPLPQTPPPAPRVDPRTEEMARRFREVEDEVAALRRMYAAGQISQEQLQEQLRQLMILDDEQIWWMIGLETDTWYKFDNNEWVPATPPPLIAVEPPPSAGATIAAGTAGAATLQFGTQDYINDSLPYISDSGQAPVPDDPYDIPLDSNNMPLPRAGVSEVDLDRTVVGTNYLATELPDQGMTVPSRPVGSQPTVASPTIPSSRFQEEEPDVPYGGTMIAQPVGYGGVASPYDATEPPEYDINEEEEDAPIYEKASERRRNNAVWVGAIIIAIIAVLALVVGVGGVFLASNWYTGIVEKYEAQIVALENYQPEFQTVTITDYQGNTLATLARDGNERINVPLERISPYVIHALVSTENPTYFEDPGWETGTTISTFVESMTGGELPDESTITQQVARRLILQTDDPSPELRREEIVIAGELTQRYDKNFILQVYLNEFFFGNQTYGIEAASQFYFDKPAADLDLAEAALMIAIMKNPAQFDPVTNREVAFKSGMNPIIEQMREVGCLDFQHGQWADNTEEFCITETPGRITRLRAGVESRNYFPREFDVEYPHFITVVRQRLETAFPGEIYRHAWTVRTTLVPELQDYAQDVLNGQLDRLADSGVTTGAVMVTDPKTGAVRVYVGSHDYYDEENSGSIDFPRTYQQAGEIIQPVIYAAALTGIDRNANGALEPTEYLTPASIIWDVAVTYADIGFTPTNADGTFRGPVGLRQALQNSYYVAAVKVFEWIGLDAFITMGNAMGITFAEGDIIGFPTAVGIVDVRLYDMMEAYGTISNDGNLMPLYVIESITDEQGNFINLPESVRPAPQNVLSPQIAYILQNILSDDRVRGPEFGQNSPLVIAGRPAQDFVAAKSATTRNRNVWTLGFTNDIVVGVWMGRPDDNQIERITGLTAAAPVWNAIMSTTLNAMPTAAGNFQNPGGVVSRTICALTGALVDNASTCADRRNEIFADSRPPLPANQGFVETVAINTWTGLRANEFCADQANIQSRTFVNIADTSAVSWLQTTAGRQWAARLGLTGDLTAAPTGACDINTIVPVARIDSPTPNETVQGVLAVLGQVGNAPTFANYLLSYAPAANPTNFITLPGFPVNTPQPNPNSQLGTWDTTAIPNGQYILRLRVNATDGGFVTFDVPVIVDNPLPTATPTPTQTLIPTLDFATQAPIPFDTLPPIGGGIGDAPQPTPTIDPSGF